MTAEDAHSESLLSQALAMTAPRGPQCSVGVLLASHPDADQIRELIEATPIRVRYSTAADTLRKIGVRIADDTLSRHRRNLCACEQR